MNPKSSRESERAQVARTLSRPESLETERTQGKLEFERTSAASQPDQT
jgi:hypothetical protein